jgi:hypothetical protein
MHTSQRDEGTNGVESAQGTLCESRGEVPTSSVPSRMAHTPFAGRMMPCSPPPAIQPPTSIGQESLSKGKLTRPPDSPRERRVVSHAGGVVGSAARLTRAWRARRRAAECGRGVWAWSVGVECGRGVWAWSVGVECGRGVWAAMCASKGGDDAAAASGHTRPSAGHAIGVLKRQSTSSDPGLRAQDRQARRHWASTCRVGYYVLRGGRWMASLTGSSRRLRRTRHVPSPLRDS